MRYSWNEPVGLPECPYLYRWVLALPSGRSVRLHHWVSSDDLRHYHDHGWDFVTILLRGGYEDHSPGGIDFLRPFNIRLRRATHRHKVKVNAAGAWSLLFTGKDHRTWGYWVDGKFRKRNKYYFEHGHAPCQQCRSMTQSYKAWKNFAGQHENDRDDVRMMLARSLSVAVDLIRQLEEAIDDLHACISVEFKDLDPRTQQICHDLHEKLHHSPHIEDTPPWT